MLARDVIGDDVDDRPDAEAARLRNQLLRFRERPEVRVDRAVIGDVVPRVGLGRRVPRVEPERVDAELGEVRQAGAHAGEVADPVAVSITEAADVHLVDDGVPPPADVGFPARIGGLQRRGHRSATIA